MSTHPLAKPNTVGTAILQIDSGVGIGVNAGDYRIKVAQHAGRVFSPSADVTGDGDAVPHFENNLMLYGVFELTGFMVADAAMGIANIIDSTKNPTGTIRFKFHSTTRFLRARVLVEGFSYQWVRAGQYVAVAMQLRATNANPVETA